MTRDEFWIRVSERLNFKPGDVVTGWHHKRGHIIGRVGIINSLGGVIVDLDNGKLAGFGPDEVWRLTVIERCHAPVQADNNGCWIDDTSEGGPIK